MLRKGNFPMKRTLGTVLGIMGLIIGVMAVMNINADTLQPGVDKIDSTIQNIGAQTATIGGQDCASSGVQCVDGSEPSPKKQFEGLIAFNMLSAADCRLVGVVSTYSRNNENIAHFEGFEYLTDETDFEPLCAGANAIDVDPTDDAAAWANPFRPQSSENANDMEGNYGKIDFEIDEDFTLNSGGNDGESVRSDISDETLMAIRLETDVLGAQRESYPDFWTGARNAVYVPGGLENNEESEGTGGWASPKDHEIQADRVQFQGSFDTLAGEAHQPTYYSVGSGVGPGANYLDATDQNDRKIVKLYSYRPRFSGVPILLPAVPDYIDQTSEGGPLQPGPFEVFTEEAQYRFCEGASGYIQSNARRMDNTGEASGDIRYIEDAVFPMVEITSGEEEKYSCISRGGDAGPFYSYSLGGSKCSVGDPENQRTEDMTLGGQNVEMICAYNSFVPSFEKFEWAEQPEVYRPGWFFDECPEGSVSLDMASDYSRTEGEVESTGENIILTGGTEISSAQWKIEDLGVQSFDIKLKPQNLGGMSPGFNGRTEIFINGESYGLIRTYHSQSPNPNLRNDKILLSLGDESTDYEISEYGTSFRFDYGESGLELRDSLHSKSLEIGDKPDQIENIRIVTEQPQGGEGETEIEIQKFETQALVTGCPSE